MGLEAQLGLESTVEGMSCLRPNPSSILRPQDLSGLMYDLQFLGCHLGGVHWTLSKSAEATVRIEIDLLRSTMLEQGFDLSQR